MPWIRTACFVTLTLVAATLPASGGTLYARSCDDADKQTGNRQSNQQDQPRRQAPRDSGPVFQLAAPDAWKTASARSLCENGHSTTTAGTLHLIVPDTQFKPTEGRLMRIDPVACSCIAQAWIVCRYPNAPPIV